MSQNGHVTFTLNGNEVRAEKGRLLIDVAEELGVFVPRFCYHPGMKSVAVCRMCLVKVEGQKKLLPACATPIDEGMNVNTVDEDAVDAQEGMLEFLLINHPLDCPICDRGGECPLQDQTYRHGPGSSRYVEQKRTYEKALEISNLVVLDRERCVLCWRCVRFADEVAGDKFIQLVDRGPGTQILTFADDPFDSYFSGNTIQICPVGALTSKPYRFVSRPWDLQTAPSVCSYCSVGCPITNETRSGKLVRCQALPNENVNDFWSCDKGRFGYHHVDSEERLKTPLVRNGEQFEPTSWAGAIDAIAEKVKGAANVAVLAGGHLTTEDAHGIAKLAKSTLKTKDVDSRIQDAGAPYELLLPTGIVGSTATINDLESASTIVWAGPDPKETLPVLYLRLRKAVLEGGARLVVVGPRRISLDVFATEVIRCAVDEVAASIRGIPEVDADSVCCWGPGAAGVDDSATLSALVEAECKLLVCPPHAGSQGMLDMGVHPAFDAGYVAVEEPGRDTRAILEAAAAGEIDVLLVFGADPVADFPDASLARRALEACKYVVVMELFPTETVTLADVVLPSVAYAERSGTFTNLERRLQRLEAVLPAAGSSMEPWRACARISAVLDSDWGWDTVENVWADIVKSVPTHKDVDFDAIAQVSPPTALQYESGFESPVEAAAIAGPGGQYPKGFRSGAPFQTGQNWPLSWELRGFEARQRPGVVPVVASQSNGSGAERSGGESSETLHRATQSVSADTPPPAQEVAGTQPSAEQSVEGRQDAGGSEGEVHSFVLISGRLIYDEGQMVRKSAALRGIARRPFVEMNEKDAAGLGVGDGDTVRVKGGEGEYQLPVVVADIAAGHVFVPFDQEGAPANTLMSGVNPRVRVAAS